MNPHHRFLLLSLLSSYTLLYHTTLSSLSPNQAYPTLSVDDSCGPLDDAVPKRTDVHGRIIDISHRYVPDMPSFNSKDGTGQVVELLQSMKNGSVANGSQFKLYAHAGTHVDAPGHFYDEYYDAGFDIDSLDLEVLNGPALLVDVPRDRNITETVPIPNKALQRENVGKDYDNVEVAPKSGSLTPTDCWVSSMGSLICNLSAAWYASAAAGIGLVIRHCQGSIVVSLNVFGGVQLQCVAYPVLQRTDTSPTLWKLRVAASVMKHLSIPKGVRRVLFRTLNTDKKLMLKKEFDSSYVGFMEDGAKWLVENTDIKLVGLDYLSVGAYVDAVPTHHIFLKSREIILVEALKLDHVKPGLYNLHCLPLRLVGSEGSPARCILIT